MSLLGLLLVLVLLGVLAWALTAYIPMPPPIRGLVIVACTLVAILLVLSAFGVVPGLLTVRVR